MAADMFLKLEGIKGESKDDKHKDEIQILSFSWGLSQTGSFGTGGGGGTGKVNIHDLTFTKNVDKSTSILMQHCCNGKHIKEGIVTIRKAGETPLEYIKWKLGDIIVSSVQESGHGGEALTESISLNFAKLQFDYQEQGPDGKAIGGAVSATWNVSTHTPNY